MFTVNETRRAISRGTVNPEGAASGGTRYFVSNLPTGLDLRVHKHALALPHPFRKALLRAQDPEQAAKTLARGLHQDHISPHHFYADTPKSERHIFRGSSIRGKLKYNDRKRGQVMQEERKSEITQNIMVHCAYLCVCHENPRILQCICVATYA